MTAIMSSVQNNARYVATLTAGVSDLVGNTINSDHSWSFTSGSLLDISDDLAVTRTISSDAYYVVANLTPAADYMVSMNQGAGSNLGLQVYSDPASEALPLCVSATTDNQEGCSASANAAGELYIQITGADQSTEFVLDVQSLDASVSDVSAGNTLDTSVTAKSHELFSLSGLSIGLEYVVILDSASDDLSLFVANGNEPFCGSDEAGRTGESCLFTASATTQMFWLQNRSDVEVSSTLSSREVSTFDGSPISLGAGEKRYLKFSGILAAQQLLTSNTVSAENVSIRAFTDAFISAQSCADLSGSIDYCVVTPITTALYVELDGAAMSAAANFDLALKPLQDVDLAQMPMVVSLDTETRYYRITGLQNQSYTALLSGLTADVDMSVFNDAVTDVCSNAIVGVASESCLATADNNSLFVALASVGVAGGQLSLLSEAYAETTVSDDTAHTEAGQTLNVDEANKYYRIDGLQANTQYLLSVNNVDTDVDLSAFSDGFVTSLCSVSMTAPARDYCYINSNANGELFVRIANADTASTASFDVVIEIPDATVLSVVNNPESILASSTKRFRFSALGGGLQEVSISQLSGNVDLKVYDNPFWTDAISSETTLRSDPATLNEFVQHAANDVAELYVELVNVEPNDNSAHLQVINAPTALVRDATLSLDENAASVGVSEQVFDLSVVDGSDMMYVLHNMSDIVSMNVSTTTSAVEVVCQGNVYNAANDAYCYAQDDDGSSQLVIDAAKVSGSGANFDLDVYPLPSMTSAVYQAETVEFSEQTLPMDDSAYYRITGLSEGLNYQLALTEATDTISMKVYDQPWIPGVSDICSSSLDGQLEVCDAVANTAGELYISVDSNAATGDVNFALRAELASTRDIDASILPAVSSLQSLTMAATRVHHISGLDTGTQYRVSLTGNGVSLGDDIGIQVYSDLEDGSMLCSSVVVGAGDEACDLLSNSTGVYVYIDGAEMLNTTEEYLLSIDIVSLPE
jgi:hypothetical protein